SALAAAYSLLPMRSPGRPGEGLGGRGGDEDGQAQRGCTGRAAVAVPARRAAAVNVAIDPELQRYAVLDQRLLAAVRGIHVLPTVAWPASLENRMIEAYGQGRFSLPVVSYVVPDLAGARAELAAIEADAIAAGADDPLGEYL